MIRCPVCKESLQRIDKTYKCKNGHSYDVAKQGYTTLLLRNASHSGDNKEMVMSRIKFLEGGYYDLLAEKLSQILFQKQGETIIDAGCGEGYYTDYLSNSLNKKIIGFDLSKSALKYASKQNKRNEYFLSSIFDMPVDDKCADVIINIFAPTPIGEFKRIIKDDGLLVIVGPGPDHLKEMKAILYENPYKNKVKPIKDFKLMSTYEVKYTRIITKEYINELYKMTPYSYKTSYEASNKLKDIKEMNMTIDFVISTYSTN